MGNVIQCVINQLLVSALERHTHSMLIQCEGGVGIHLIVVGTTTFLDRVCSEFTLKCGNIPTLGSLFDQLLHDWLNWVEIISNKKLKSLQSK